MEMTSVFRVECNFGCRYFTSMKKAYAYFSKCCAKRLPVEIWWVHYEYDDFADMYFATQDLLDYANSDLPHH